MAAQPVAAAEFDEAYLANAIFDAHRDDPEFGYRFFADEVHDAASARPSAPADLLGQGWSSVFSKKKPRKRGTTGTPAHDDLVRRDFAPHGRAQCEEGRLSVTFKSCFGKSNRQPGANARCRTASMPIHLG